MLTVYNLWRLLSVDSAMSLMLIHRCLMLCVRALRTFLSVKAQMIIFSREVHDSVWIMRSPPVTGIMSMRWIDRMVLAGP